MPQPLTKTQAIVLAFAVDYFKVHDRLPSAPTLMRQFGWKSQNSGYLHLQALAEKGYLQKDDSYFRFSRAWLGRPRVTDNPTCSNH